MNVYYAQFGDSFDEGVVVVAAIDVLAAHEIVLSEMKEINPYAWRKFDPPTLVDFERLESVTATGEPRILTIFGKA